MAARALPPLFRGSCPSLLLGLFCATALVVFMGCESSDPCLLRHAACLDVAMTGERNPVYYTGVKVAVTLFAPGIVAPPPVTVDRIPAEGQMSAYAGAQDMVSFMLPDAFNALPDIFSKENRDNPASQAAAIDLLPSQGAMKAALLQLRATDPRAIQVTVDATRVSGSVMTLIHWDSREQEDKYFSLDQWTMMRYYRVGQDQYVAIYPVLAPPTM